jgi:BCD family chlorophyll transporter-like MFS transporter
MVALPMLFAPFRALIGFRSDHHKSAIGWRRVPYLWGGSLLQFGGLAIMPFALLLLSGDGNAPIWVARAAAALAFLLVGLGLHTSQTAGLALATDIAPEEKRPQVVAMLYVVLLLGMLVSALVFGALLSGFTQIKLIQVIQGAAILTMVLNCVALWKQESRQPDRNTGTRPAFGEAWARYTRAASGKRFLVAVILGTAGFSMQDILLEPYGAEILGLSVSATTVLTAILAGGSLAAFMVAAWRLQRAAHPTRVAASGVLIGIVAFSIVIFAEPLQSPTLFRAGTALIGFGGGLFGVSTLIMAMTMVDKEHTGLSLGAWGAAQATAAGVGIALGGLIRDSVTQLAVSGALGEALSSPAVGYSVVYHLEIALLFVALVALGPLTSLVTINQSESRQFGLAEFPN